MNQDRARKEVTLFVDGRQKSREFYLQFCNTKDLDIALQELRKYEGGNRDSSVS
jgi:hypothetical protein